MRLKEDDRIDNTVFRERFRELQEKEGLTLADVAIRMGWINLSHGKGDSGRAGRALGLASKSRESKTVSRVVAKELCDALHMDYVDVGI